MLRFVLSLAVVTAVPGLAPAQEGTAAMETYAALKAGPVMPKHDDLDGFDNGLGFEVAVGFRASESLALEVGIGRFAMGLVDSGYVESGGYIYPATLSVDIAAIPVTATAKVLIPADKARLYGLIGAGVYFMSCDAKLAVQGYQAQTTSNSTTAFALHLGGGVDFLVAPNVRIGVEAKYLMGKADLLDTGDEVNFDSLSFGAALVYSL